MPDHSSGSSTTTFERRSLFWACFTAIAATAAVFAVRGQVINDWAIEFGLTETQKGEILGVGLWPFAAAIVIVSLFADRVGYGKCLVFAFGCHVASVFILIFARDYWWLYVGTFVVSVGNGVAQAVADPLVASMYRHNKTTWLNILHAGWPAGMVVGGIAGIALGTFGGLEWRWRIAMLLAPMLLYGALMIGRRFPVHERIEAGVSDREMFRETGAIGLFLVLVFLFGEFGRLLSLPWYSGTIAAAVVSGLFGLYTRSLGRPIFLILLVLMIPLATTELGTDSWITSLMETSMKVLGLNAGWVLVYTSFIMMVLRFAAGPVVRALSPLGVLIVSSVLAVVGLLALSKAEGLAVLAAATIYGVGKTYLWPTMLGIVAERFPKGGALSINATSAVGMMSVGVMGTVFLGTVQDRTVETYLRADHPALHQQVVTNKHSVLGQYRAVDRDQVMTLEESDQKMINDLGSRASKHALAITAIFPAGMLLAYVCLYLVFRNEGGYRTVALDVVLPTKNSGEASRSAPDSPSRPST